MRFVHFGGPDHRALEIGQACSRPLQRRKGDTDDPSPFPFIIVLRVWGGWNGSRLKALCVVIACIHHGDDGASPTHTASAHTRARARRAHVCRQGRTGTVVAAVLMTGAGGRHSLRSAIAAMRAARPGMLRNPLQQMYLIYLRRTLATIH